MDSPRNRSLILWLAALAILWGVLAPNAVASVAAGAGQAWSDVCTSAGSRLVAYDRDIGDSQAVHPGMHCAACVFEEQLALVAHPYGSPGPASASVERIVRLHPSIPAPLAASRSSHPSRAPPALT